MIRTTKAKAIAAAIGGVCTVVAGVFADDVLDVGELGSLLAALVSAAGTVYAVWKTKNQPVPPSI